MSLSRALSRPLSRSLTRTLTAGSSFLDADASAYLAAVLSAGATVSAGQIAAVDTFYKSAKADSYYTSLKRLYLPIWGVAAANAIDMITLATGTFVGSVTHAAGYTQTDAATGYFDFNVLPAAIGLGAADSMLCAVVYAAPTTGLYPCVVGAYSSNNGSLLLAQYSSAPAYTSLDFNANGGGGLSTSLAAPVPSGGAMVFSASASLVRARSNGSSIYTSSIVPSGSPVLPDVSIRAHRNGLNNTTFDGDSDIKLGAYGAGLSMSSGNQDSFAASLKTMWETATGLTL